jgi:hypothetical protein
MRVPLNTQDADLKLVEEAAFAATEPAPLAHSPSGLPRSTRRPSPVDSETGALTATQARSDAMSWRTWARLRRMQVADYLLSFWRGERNLLWTCFAGLGLIKLPYTVFAWVSPASLDWTQDYRRVMWANAIAFAVAVLCAAIFAVSLVRSTHRSWGLWFGKLWASVVCLVFLPLAPGVVLYSYDDEMLGYWWATVRGNYAPIDVYADPHLGRIVIQGAMRLGSAEAVQAVLTQNPQYRLAHITRR